jgi:hypothetical protein
MGCDIHFVIERKTKKHEQAKWIGVWCSGTEIGLLSEPQAAQVVAGAKRFDMYNDTTPALVQRDYSFFGALAGVRTDGPAPKGLPNDLSELARDEVDEWAGDGHSFSWDTLYQFVHTWLSVRHPGALMQSHIASPAEATQLVADIAGNWLSFTDDATYEYRVVYWFDN